MDYKFFTKLRNNLNTKDGVVDYKIRYDDSIIFNEDFKNFLNLNNNNESLLKIYSILSEYIKDQEDLNNDVKLRKLLNLKNSEKLDKINIYKYFNNLIINYNCFLYMP
tara:strand:- start:243 stop:566 length:324 start_codon:yes stop_codon:yes gene_type:complete